MNTSDVIATIDTESLQEIRERYGSTVTPDRREKYLDLEYWIGVSIDRARQLGLHKGPPRRVLDLGCGAGYFLYVCKLLGHDVMGVDCPEPRGMYTDVRSLLSVPWTPHTIAPLTPLPPLGRFDVMTAHMVCFNGHRSFVPGERPPPAENLWGAKEWAFLLDDVRAPTVHLELNAEADGTIFPAGLREFFVDRGATIDEHRVLISDVNRQMSEFALARLTAMGEHQGGLNNYYAKRARSHTMLRADDLAVAEYVSRTMPPGAPVLELAAGAAQLGHLLALRGYAVSAVEIDRLRHAFAVSLGEHLGSTCEVILSPWQDLDLPRWRLLVTLNAVTSHIFPTDTRWLVEYASKGGEFIIRPRQFGAGIPVEIPGLKATQVFEDVYHYRA